jgi:hypothetical protein
MTEMVEFGRDPSRRPFRMRGTGAVIATRPKENGQKT